MKKWINLKITKKVLRCLFLGSIAILCWNSSILEEDQKRNMEKWNASVNNQGSSNFFIAENLPNVQIFNVHMQRFLQTLSLPLPIFFRLHTATPCKPTHLFSDWNTANPHAMPSPTCSAGANGGTCQRGQSRQYQWRHAVSQHVSPVWIAAWAQWVSFGSAAANGDTSVPLMPMTIQACRQ